MTTYHGNDGVVEVGANAVGEVTEFSVQTSAQTTDNTAMGDEFDTHLVHRKAWNGSLSCNNDPSDTNGQAALLEGASVVLTLYPTGNASGRQTLSGTATITGVDTRTNKDGVVSANFTFQGNGALTRGSVI